jgi:hypothetical protein
MAKHRPYIHYSPELMLEICRRLGEGAALRVICRQKGMPHFTKVHEWILTKPGVGALYEAALEIRGQSLADEIMELADEPPKYFTDKNGRSRVDMGWVQAQRLRVDTRKWLSCKLYPSRYGDRIEHTGKDGKPIEYRDVSSLTDDELSRIALAGSSGEGTVKSAESSPKPH